MALVQSRCTEPGCRNLSDGGKCKSCCKERNKRNDARRLSPSRRGYDRAWKKVRDLYRDENPFCEEHLKSGQYVPTYAVDHIIPHNNDDKLRLSFDNLRALCLSCHSSKTVLHDGGFGRKKALEASVVSLKVEELLPSLKNEIRTLFPDVVLREELSYIIGRADSKIVGVSAMSITDESLCVEFTLIRDRGRDYFGLLTNFII